MRTPLLPFFHLVEKRAAIAIFVCVVAVVWASTLSCTARKAAPPDTSSTTYLDAVRAFNVGLAALETGDDTRADASLRRLTELAPPEPAGWCDRGLLAFRHGELDQAAEHLDRARDLAPDEARIHALRGLVASAAGRTADALSELRRTVELDADDVRSRYALAQAVEGAGDGAEAERAWRDLLERRPDNAAAAVELLRVAATRGDVELVRETISRVRGLSTSWPADVQEKLDDFGGDQGPAAAATAATVLRNALLPVPSYRLALGELTFPTGAAGEPLTKFLWLPSPDASPPPADDALRFDLEPVPSAPGGAWSWVGALASSADASPTMAFANDRVLETAAGASLPFPGPASTSGILSFDADYDFKPDVLTAGPKGLRLYIQTAAGAFEDATRAMKLPAAVTGGDYTGAWAADIESDGDLDVVLARRVGSLLAIRNNGDGTFTTIDPFLGTANVRAFVWADFDRDGDDDAAVLDQSGTLTFFANERLGRFRQLACPSDRLSAIGAADADGDGAMDLVALRADGGVVRMSEDAGGTGWSSSKIGRFERPSSPGSSAIFAGDLDNNGAVDVIATGDVGGMLWLGEGGGTFKQLDILPSMRIRGLAELTGDGRLDLIGATEDGQPIRAVGRGARDYAWLDLRPRARATDGDRRVNTFGIGGEVEVSAGLLYQKQPIDSPIVHIGLGKQAGADVARIRWPNGLIQAEFELQSDTPVVFDQRLEGSCPWLFAYDGSHFGFVTDLIWRSPLGLRLNAQDTGRVMQTEDWVRIRGNQLVARDGFYDLRVTAELWETHFFDHLSLRVIDHPVGTEVFVDERFAVPPPALEIQKTGPLHRVAGAWDDAGRDVADVVGALDGRYLDTFARGPYQGIARDHFVELDLDDATSDGPLWLVATGWIHPTDSSINVAVSQGSSDGPQGLRLEIPDGRGGWTVARDGLGFPEGKNKTILLRLDDLLRPGLPRRVRLRTNLEIYWDSLAWTTGVPDLPIETRQLDLAAAELRYRGFSSVAQADASSPEVPEYDRLAGTRQRWLDLVGFYTRFGDVRPLLQRVDDRYVIMNAGDELVLRFEEPPPPPAGWTRDFVLVGDGWVKDGNFNTTFSATVLPLPLHGQPDYTTPPQRLPDDPAYRLHPEDWTTYHTRFVAPDDVGRSLSR